MIGLWAVLLYVPGRHEISTKQGSCEATHKVIFLERFTHKSADLTIRVVYLMSFFFRVKSTSWANGWWFGSFQQDHRLRNCSNVEECENRYQRRGWYCHKFVWAGYWWWDRPLLRVSPVFYCSRNFRQSYLGWEEKSEAASLATGRNCLDHAIKITHNARLLRSLLS